ncbi:hypothetical protein L7F22_008671 [Adiantum nelumboides]|nr:hypothetical protein [Adiantum nelumboides]
MQGFNMGRYRPPDADPRAQSFNSLTGTNPYGKRGRKLDAGILVVRFELPFNIWCGHCQTHIGQGVRFNAEKTKVGNYFTTPIFRFRCKTTCCQHHFEIETDPKHARYVVVSGAKAQAQPGDEGSGGGGGGDGDDGLLVLDDGTGDRWETLGVEVDDVGEAVLRHLADLEAEEVDDAEEDKQVSDEGRRRELGDAPDEGEGQEEEHLRDNEPDGGDQRAAVGDGEHKRLQVLGDKDGVCGDEAELGKDDGGEDGEAHLGAVEDAAHLAKAGGHGEVRLDEGEERGERDHRHGAEDTRGEEEAAVVEGLAEEEDAGADKGLEEHHDGVGHGGLAALPLSTLAGRASP